MDFKWEVAAIIGKAADMETEQIVNAIEVPPEKKMGDYAFPCFKLAAKFKKAPPLIAQELAAGMDCPEFIRDIQVQGAYINFYLNQSFYAASILKQIWAQKENYGQSSIGAGKSVVIDYSSPNIAKPFHVGHLRSTAIGNALKNIYQSLGYNTIGVNHLGDWGTQFGKLITAYKLWGDEEEVNAKGIEELNRLYVKFHDEAEKDESLNDTARNWFLKMQQGDEEALKLWKWFYDLSLKEFEGVYKLLDVAFDAYTGESFYNDKMDAVVAALEQKGLLLESDGAMIVDLEAYQMPPCLIIRKDGGTLYATRDITAALYRKNHYKSSKIIYITAVDQKLHFAQWFKVIGLMGYDWEKELVHVPFGLVSLESGKLSTRKGNVILMEDLLREAIAKTEKIIEDKNPDLPNKKEISKEVGIGAVIFHDLYHNRIKDVVFSWDKMLNFDGETGPYVQYAHARACSIVRKAGDVGLPDGFEGLDDGASLDVVKALAQFSDKVLDAANKYEPSIVTRYLVDLAQAFNKFYYDNRILDEKEDVKKARVLLTYCVKIVLKQAMALIGMKAPEEM